MNKEVLRAHGLWVASRGKEGARADLRRANLSGASLSEAILPDANLRRADLSGADLWHANLWRADLSGADLSGADLWHANLSDAILSGADLSGADLSGVRGNMAEIKSTQVERWSIAYTNTILYVGCEGHKIEEWREFTDERIAQMDPNALDFWNKFKNWIFETIRLSPAR